VVFRNELGVVDVNPRATAAASNCTFKHLYAIGRESKKHELWRRVVHS
jgi:hypothetical protein